MTSLRSRVRSRALSNQVRGFTVVIVVHDAGRVVGYYVLASFGCPDSGCPGVRTAVVRTAQKMSPTPDQALAGREIATGLFKHALERSVAGAQLVGGRALVVSAVDDDAAKFWRRRGFLPSKDDPLVLF